MIELELQVNGADPNLSTVGEIFAAPLLAGAAPLVTDVIARGDRNARFSLEAGAYEYQFSVDLGTGTFALALQLADGTAAVANQSYDTADGFRGRVLRFEVGQ